MRCSGIWTKTCPLPPISWLHEADSTPDCCGQKPRTPPPSSYQSEAFSLRGAGQWHFSPYPSTIDKAQYQVNVAKSWGYPSSTQPQLTAQRLYLDHSAAENTASPVIFARLSSMSREAGWGDLELLPFPSTNHPASKAGASLRKEQTIVPASSTRSVAHIFCLGKVVDHRTESSKSLPEETDICNRVWRNSSLRLFWK